MHTAHGRHGHQHEHERAQMHPPVTEGRLIRWARLYEPFVWVQTLGQVRTLRTIPLDMARLRPGEQVLDVGCGTGELTLGAARRVGPTGTVYGIDASPEMIEVARRQAHRAGNAGSTVKFLIEPVEAMSFPDGSFDVVLSSFMMHHLPGDLKRRALLEIRRVLRPGGRLVVVDLQATAHKPRPWDIGWLITRLHKQSTSSPAEVRAAIEARAALLRDAGFDAVESGTTRYSWLGYTLGRAPA